MEKPQLFCVGKCVIHVFIMQNGEPWLVCRTSHNCKLFILNPQKPVLNTLGFNKTKQQQQQQKGVLCSLRAFLFALDAEL